MSWLTIAFIIPLGIFGFHIVWSLFLLLFRFYTYRKIVKAARVLVCSLGDKPVLVEEAEGEAEIYRRYFPAVEVFKAPKLADLLAALYSGDFHILHILTEFADDGMIVETQGTRADVDSLLVLCRTKGLLFVYFGGNIPGEIRDAVFERTAAARVGHDFPLVITSNRGTQFHSFLDRLLHQVASGKLLANAGLKLRPQDTPLQGAPQPEGDPGPQAVVLT